MWNCRGVVNEEPKGGFGGNWRNVEREKASGSRRCRPRSPLNKFEFQAHISCLTRRPTPIKLRWNWVHFVSLSGGWEILTVAEFLLIFTLITRWRCRDKTRDGIISIIHWLLFPPGHHGCFHIEHWIINRLGDWKCGRNPPPGAQQVFWKCPVTGSQRWQKAPAVHRQLEEPGSRRISCRRLDCSQKICFLFFMFVCVRGWFVGVREEWVGFKIAPWERSASVISKHNSRFQEIVVADF